MAATRRQQYPIVDRSVQYRLLAIVLSYGVAIVLFLAISLFLPDILAMGNGNATMGLRQEAAEKMLTLHARVWPAVVALLCVLGIHSFRVFLRLIGPLHRLRRALMEVGQGDLSFRLKLRENDYLHAEGKVFNEMMVMLVEKLRTLQEAAFGSLKSLDALDVAVTRESSSAATSRQLLRTHREHLDLVMESLRYFRLDPENFAGRDSVKRQDLDSINEYGVKPDHPEDPKR